MKHILTLFIAFLILPDAFAIESYFNRNPRTQYKEPYRNLTRQGDNLEAVIIREINKAQKSIYIAVQEFRLPMIAQALAAKMKAGVDVRVIVEHDYNFDVLHQKPGSAGESEESDNRNLRGFIDINADGKLDPNELNTRDAIYILNRGKIPVIDDTVSAATTSGSGLMHHKFMVVDGKTTIVTTANFTMSCIHGDYNSPDTRGNPNSMDVFHSVPFATIFTEEFMIMWGNGKNGNFGQNKVYRGPRNVTVDGSKITIQFSPTSKNLPFEQSTNGLIVSFMKKAKRSFKSALFVFSEQLLVDALETRHDAGVDVGVIIESRFAYRDYSELLDMLGVEMLGVNCKPEPGNKPWKNPITEGGMANLGGDKLHHKYAVIDGKYTLVGSHNWSDSANNTNDETFLVIENTSISDLYTQEYERLKSNATLGVTSKAELDIQNRKDNCARKP